MTRNRSTRKMRNRRNKSRSKRGGVWSMFQSGEMKKFTDILRGNVIIKDKYMDDGSANLHILLDRHKPDDKPDDKLDKMKRMKKILFDESPDASASFTKLKDFWSGLQPDQRAKLKEELSKANKKFLYEGVVDILEAENISPAAPANDDGDYTSSEGYKLLSKQAGGKSRRHRRRRHRTIKNRKSRKGHRTRRNKLRNKRGGMHSLFQHGLLPEYKRKLRSSSLNDLLQNFKDSGQTKLDQETINEIDTVYDSKSKTGELNIFLLKLNNEQVGELLQNIKDQTTEGKAFYRYVLLKFLADNGRAEAQSILGGMFEIGEGVPLDRDKGLALLKSAGAHGDANVRADWSTYVSGL